METILRAMRWTTWAMILACLALVFGLSDPSHATAATSAPTTAGSGAINGSVTKDGQPIANVRVSLLALPDKGARLGKQPKGKAGKAGGAAAKALAQTTTDADGKFNFNNIVPGTYVVMAVERGEGRGRQRVVVADGQSPDVKIALSGGKAQQKNKQGNKAGKANQ